jgi:hypothetical protein
MLVNVPLSDSGFFLSILVELSCEKEGNEKRQIASRKRIKRSRVRAGAGVELISLNVQVLQFLIMPGYCRYQYLCHGLLENLFVAGILILKLSDLHTAKEGPVRIQFKCLVSIYIFPEMKLLFPEQNSNVLSPRTNTHISVRGLYISRIGLPILLQGNMWTDHVNI